MLEDCVKTFWQVFALNKTETYYNLAVDHFYNLEKLNFSFREITKRLFHHSSVKSPSVSIVNCFGTFNLSFFPYTSRIPSTPEEGDF